MLFPTLDFALFFVVVFAISWLIYRRDNARHVFLLAASYFFYSYWDWRFSSMMFLASCTAWAAGKWLQREQDEKIRKRIVFGACLILLGNLGFFKYYGFFLESLFPILDAIGWGRDALLLQIVLPIGISFFTFQAISYVVDVYRKEINARSSLVDLLLYISFFPQLVAGPIVRASHFLPQLDRTPVLTRRTLTFGLAMCMVGLFKKMVIANYLAVDLVDKVFFDPTVYSSFELLMGVYGYAVQIYCDFSGYSDIAIGTAALLGFRFQANFRQPYRSASLQEFWRRWHISLSQWLRDYLYRSLGGNRKGPLITQRNLFLTMVLGGLWHGAAWTFVIWGFLHGAGLAIERMFRRGGELSLFVKAAAIIGTFHFVCVGWIFFRAQSLDSALSYFSGLAKLTPDYSQFSVFPLLLIAGSMAFQFVPKNTTLMTVKFLTAKPFWVTVVAFALALMITDLFAPPGTAPFIYFQF